MSQKFYIITGGTLNHVAPHFAVCAPAYGRVGAKIAAGLRREFTALLGDDRRENTPDPNDVILVRTSMALGCNDPSEEEAELFLRAGLNRLETNEDLSLLLDYLIDDWDTKGIVLAAAVCDWEPRCYTFPHEAAVPRVQGVIGKAGERLQTSEGTLEMQFEPSDKLIGKIRCLQSIGGKIRKDIFLVGFKATTGFSEQKQYIRGLRLLKDASCNIVFANDMHNRRNMVITPEEAKYHVTTNRDEAIQGLCEMIAMRSGLHFTRSTVVEGAPIPWTSPAIPLNLRTVVNHLIHRGAYKPFLGKTVGHFATRGPEPGVIFTSRRKSNFNNLAQDGLLRIDTVDDDRVVAYGAKPSVGGQSQRIIFDQHRDVDCIVHAHVPLREGAKLDLPVRPQRPYECGSHECGQNTSEGLTEVWPGIKAVMLDEHGPNICFSKDADPGRVIEFIEQFWDLESKTGGPVEI